MAQTRILLWQLASSTELVDELVGVLRNTDRSVETVLTDTASVMEDGLAALARRRQAGAAFIVLPNPPVAPELRKLGEDRSELPIFAVTAADDPETLLALLRLGLHDFLRPPLQACEVLPRLWRSLERSVPRQKLRGGLKRSAALGRLIGRSPAFLAESEKIPLLSRCDVPVLICGETGTGKEVFARAIHGLSPRSRNGFVPINCGAIPADLVENELFGHERGAFTGAASARPGLLEEADGGTVLFDEVDTLPLAAQVKLLRFLQDKEFRRLGSTRLARSDVRVLAATNSKIETVIERGGFRRDLFYRLNGVPVRLPPLRERREDIPLLAEHFLRRYAEKFGRRIEGFTDEMTANLLAYDWPGNIRELQHVVQRAVVLSENERLIESRRAQLPVESTKSPPVRLSFKEAKAQVVASFERRYVESMLATHGGNITRAARAARKDRRGFFELIRKHGIDARRFRPADVAGRLA